MGFQAGCFYFDRSPVPPADRSAILTAAPLTYSHDQIILACTSGFKNTPDHSITFDGRLDNRADLRLQLGVVDPSAAALSLAAYTRWGADGFLHLIGDWSLAIWDAPQRALVLASDFAGVRPLYYFADRRRVYWSTRLDLLVQWTGATNIDDEFVAGFLACGGCRNLTPYRGIYSVPPGHSVRFTTEGAPSQAFWQLPGGNTIRYQRPTDYEEHLRSLFHDAVRSRLATTRPVLAELSGGLDSSSIVCMASGLIKHRLTTLSFEHPGSIDEPFYAALAKHCDVENIRASTSDHPFLTELSTGDAIPEFWTEMHAHAASIAHKIGADTYLTGQLGDVVMGNWGDDSVQVAGLLRTGRIAAALKDSLAWSKVLRIPIYWVLWRALRANFGANSNPTTAHCSTEDSLAASFRQAHDPSNFVSRAWAQAPPEQRPHLEALASTLELRKLQPPGPLQHLHYTHPFAHRPLVEFMLSIPPEIVCGSGEPRRLMRRAFHGLWPPQLRRRRSKDGFGGTFLESLRPLAAALLQRRTLQVVERGYIDAASLRARFERLSASLECNDGQLRHIILLELWLAQRDRRKTVSLPA